MTPDFVVVYVNSDGDGVMGLYNRSGTLVMSGDDYHDKIHDNIQGYIKGWTDGKGFIPTVDYRYYNSRKAIEKYCEMGDSLPQSLSSIRCKQDPPDRK